MSLDTLTELAYHELRQAAHRHLTRSFGPAARPATLDTVALVHEVYLKLSPGARGQWRDLAHFRASASVAMRHILVDRALMRATQRHGGEWKQVTLDGQDVAANDDPETLLAIDAALTRLADVAPRLARLVELRFFGGLSDGEVAYAMGVTKRTVQRDWIKARLLLARALGE